MTPLKRIMTLVGIAESLGPNHDVFTDKQVDNIFQIIDDELGVYTPEEQVAVLNKLAHEVYDEIFKEASE